jgi:hypothetical protein
MRWRPANPGLPVDVRGAGSDRAQWQNDRVRSRRDGRDNAGRLEQLLFPE